MDDKPYIPVLLGTSRKGNLSQKVAKFVSHEAERYGFESNVISPKDHLQFPVTARAGKETKKRTAWHLTMKRAAGLIIVTPEYNHGYPGELKLMIDQLFDEYKDKPVMVFGVSSGKTGGARAVENLIPVLIEVRMRFVVSKVYFPEVQKLLSKRGTIKSKKYKELMAEKFEMFEEYLEFDK